MAEAWRVVTNRHRSTDGRAWGWIEAPDKSHVLFWTGVRQRERAERRAAELDLAGWGSITDAERAHV